MNQTLRVMSWNLWWRFGAWGHRQSGLLRTMRDATADIIGVQECWPEQIQGFADDLEFHSVTSEPDPESEFGFVNAILSRWPIELSKQENLPSLDGPARRSVLMARTRTPFGPIPFFTTHLDWQYDRSAHRQTQLETVCEFVAQNTGDPEQFPAILTGDLNAVPDSDEIRRMTGRSAPYVPGMIFSDSWEQVGHGEGHTWSETNPNLQTPAWPNRRLDYVMTQWPRERPKGNPAAATLVGMRAVDGAVPSDHYGLVVDLKTQ